MDNRCGALLRVRNMQSEFPFRCSRVEDYFSVLSDPARQHLMVLRKLVFDTARTTSGVGRIEEALRWRQPAYLTPETRSGSTIRLGASRPGKVAIYAHCRTTLIADFRTHFPDGLEFEGNRAVHLPVADPIPVERLAHLVRAALTYHQR